MLTDFIGTIRCGTCGLLVTSETGNQCRHRIERHMIACLLRRNGFEAQIDFSPPKRNAHWSLNLACGRAAHTTDGWYILEYGHLVANSLSFAIFYDRLAILLHMRAFES